MTEIEDIKALMHQLVKEYMQLIENKADFKADFFEIKSLESEILKTEAQLRTFEDF